MKAKRLSITSEGSSNTREGYLIQNQTTLILFDPPSVIFDEEVEISDISDRKYIEIEVLKEYPENISSIFITNSNALSVFFTDSNVPIYLTEPVYKQMKERLRYYVSLGLVSKRRENNKRRTDGTKIVEMCTYKKISRRVKFIKYNQIIDFTYLSVLPQPAGISLGWIMYVITQGKERVCAYTYAVTGGASLSEPMAQQPKNIPLIINHLIDKNKPDIQTLTKTISEQSERTGPFVITMDILNCAVEMSLHILSVLKNRTIFVSHEGFKRIMQSYEMKRDVFASKFIEDSSILSTLFSTSRLKVLGTAKILEIIKTESSVILCDPLTQRLFYSDLPVIHLADYFGRFMGGISDALALKWPSAYYVNKHTLYKEQNKPSKPIESIAVDGHTVISDGAMHTIKLCNTEKIHKVTRNNSAVSLHFSGNLKETSAGLILECTESPLGTILNENTNNNYIVNDSIICSTNDAIYKIHEENGTVTVKRSKAIEKSGEPHL